MLAVSHYANEYISFGNLSGIRIDDLCRISRPVHFDLLPGLAGDMHGGATLLLMLLNVIAELRVHQGIIAVTSAVLEILCPE